MVDFNKTSLVDEGIMAEVDALFEYQPWDEKQILCGKQIRKCLADTFIQILACVPPCDDRSAALRKIREARMDCNSAITHKGKY